MMKKNVLEYIEMTKGYDGHDLIDILQKYLPDGSTLLELGMGPGKDLDVLAEHYKVTGSDRSLLFLDRYRKLNPSADLLQLDALKLETERKFDCIYSNKVLHQLTTEELRQSFRRQAELLNTGGIALHSLWYGDKPEEQHLGFRLFYYTEETLQQVIGEEFEVVQITREKDIEEGDSLAIVLRKR